MVQSGICQDQKSRRPPSGPERVRKKRFSIRKRALRKAANGGCASVQEGRLNLAAAHPAKREGTGEVTGKD